MRFYKVYYHSSTEGIKYCWTTAFSKKDALKKLNSEQKNVVKIEEIKDI